MIAVTAPAMPVAREPFTSSLNPAPSATVERSIIQAAVSLFMVIGSGGYGAGCVPVARNVAIWV